MSKRGSWLGVLCALGIAGVVGNAHAQVPQPGQTLDQPLTLPTEQKPLPRQISFLKSLGTLRGVYAYAPSSMEIEVYAPSGTGIKIRSIESMRLPGNKTTLDLFHLVDADAPTSGTTAVTASTSSGTPEPILNTNNQLPSMQQDPTITTMVTIKKKLVFDGIAKSAVANPDTFFRSFAIEIEAGGATGSGTKKTQIVLTNDKGLPAFVSTAAEADGDKFPPVSAPDDGVDHTYTLNFVRVRMHVDIVAKNFTVIRATPPDAFNDVYQAVVEYNDGAKFAYPIHGEGKYGTDAWKMSIDVPNIHHGGFKLSLRTPFGRVTDSKSYSFPSNLFVTNIPVAIGKISLVNVDTPMFPATIDDFWTPATFQYTVLAKTRKPNEVYGEWDSVILNSVSKKPLGVATGKITRTPSDGTIVSNDNMPAFSCSSAGIGTIEAHWTAKVHVFLGEDPQYKIFD